MSAHVGPTSGRPGRGIFGRRQLATTADGVEMALVVAFVSFRAVNLLQLLTAAPAGLKDSPRIGLDIGLLTLFTVETLLVGSLALSRSTLLVRGLAVADIATALVVLAGQALISRESDRLGTWQAWGYAVTLSSALLAGMACRRRATALVSVALLMGAYLAVSLPPQTTSTHSSTAVTNATAYLAFGGIGFAVASYLRRLGADADSARAAAAASAAEAETERHRRLLHDQATVLHLLGQDIGDAQLDAALRRQAASGAATIEAFMSGRTTISAPAGSLGRIVRDVAADFADLPLTVSADLADLTAVSPDVSDAVTASLRTLLHNVRRHAHATGCVVHAAADPRTGAWEIVVRDDGVGFDTTTTALGYGLTHQAGSALAARGVHVDMATAVGEGTTVTLTSRAQPMPSPGRQSPESAPRRRAEPPPTDR